MTLIFLFTESLAAAVDVSTTLRQFGRLSTPIHENIPERHLEVRLAGRESQGLAHHYDVKLRFSSTDASPDFSVSEAFVQFVDEAQTRYSVGRKILSWNPTESFWNLGILNGSPGFDLLDNHQEGSIGLHLERDMGAFELRGLISFLNLPQLGPGYEDEGGQLRARSQWSFVPPRYIRYNGFDIPIEYTIEVPSTREIIKRFILREGLGLYLGYNYSQAGKLSLYSAYKPEHPFRLLFSGYYQPGKEGIGKAKVGITPHIAHHFLLSAGVSHHIGDLQLDAFVDFVRPRKKEEAPRANTFQLRQSYFDELYFKAAMSYRRPGWKVSLHYLKLYMGLYSPAHSFDKIPIWRNALGTAFSYTLRDKWMARLDYRRDLELADSTFKGELGYRFSKRLTSGLGVELLDSSSSRSFWQFYSNNDRAYAFLTYQL